MTKSIITKVWIGGLAVFAAGIVVAIVGVFLMLGYGGTFTQIAGTDSYDFQPNMDGSFWVPIGLIVIGGLIGVIGSITQFVAWVGGLVNSYALPSKAWFLALLLGGLLSFVFAPIGFGAMLAYVVGAPDGTVHPQVPTPTPMQQPGPLLPTT
ncbi:MAG TPA: hypothetical protein VOB72_18585 [Candidatus Dormibacteraeota bacterium]|nr:hypothetical protein [Candidatus Dormibacteraeota bacterium]